MPPIPPSVKVLETGTEGAKGLNTLRIKGFHAWYHWNQRIRSKILGWCLFGYPSRFLSNRARCSGVREDHPGAPETRWGHESRVLLRVCTAKHACTLLERNVLAFLTFSRKKCMGTAHATYTAECKCVRNWDRRCQGLEYTQDQRIPQLVASEFKNSIKNNWPIFVWPIRAVFLATVPGTLG